MDKNNTHVLVLTSGGLDSTACIHFYLNHGYKVNSLFIDYGQLSKENEELASSEIARYYNISYTKIKLDLKKKISYGEIIGRNLLLISTALLASNFKSGIIALGIHSGTNYFDCTKEFVDKLSIIIDLYSKNRIKIGTPFLAFYKNEIWDYCKQFKIPFDLTYSCELGKKQPCNKCLSCKDLKRLYASKK